MRAPKILLTLSAALLIIGAGCDNSAAVTNTNAGALVLPEESSATNVNASETTAVDTNADVDPSWKTYTNAALGFTFKWPATGRYAPKWDASFAKEGDARIKDDCFVAADGKTETVSVGGVSFCHTSVDAKDGASAADYYVTKKGNQYVVLTFTKSKDAGKDYSWSDYRAGLAKIVATYSAGK